MLKWFAPLLLLAGKPEVLIRLVVGVLAGGVLFFGVWLISNIALTFDTLKNPYIAAAYGAVLFCFFLVVGMVTWLRLRRWASPAKLAPPRAEPELPLPTEIVSKRAKELSNKWEAENRRAVRQPIERIVPTPVPTEPQRAAAPARAIFAVTGPAYTGKTALIGVLAEATSSHSADTGDIVRLIDAGPIDGDERHIAALVAKATLSDGVLFVVDQDLRAPEVAAIARFVATGKPLYVVFNKADQFNTTDRDAIMVSIRAKMPAGFALSHVVSAAAAPMPVEREVEDARGAVRVELRRPSKDVDALVKLLSRFVQPSAGRTLRFEAAS
jgi:hypothetical protein